MVMALAGQAAAHSLQAMHLSEEELPFFSSGVASEGVFSSELGGEGSLFVGVVDGPLGLEGVEEGAEEHGVVVLWRDPLSESAGTLL